MTHLSKLLFAAALAALIPSLALAGEKRVAESQVPKAVLEAVKQKYAGARLTGFEEQQEGKQTTYEVKLEEGSVEREVVLTPDGKPVSEETGIAPDAVPQNVRQALTASKHGKASLEKAEKVVFTGKEDAPQYELLVSEGGKRTELVFDHDGKLLKEEPKASKPHHGKAGHEAEEKAR
jgi:hypothetical protein